MRERLDDSAALDLAIARGVREALRRHMLLGESVVVADEHGKPKTLGPQEIRRVLDQA